MCGIAGVFALEPGTALDRDRVRAMSACIAHRGPDDQGEWRDPEGRAILAHRRLSIIDLESGQQPMIDESTGSAIVFNGEIYNYVELQAVLRARGIALTTKSDTEVLLKLLDLEGPEAVHRLHGMFAFGYYDAPRRRFMLCRDRIGKKPLYYTTIDGALHFASTFSAIMTNLGAPNVDVGMVDAFLALGYVPAPATIDRRVRKLAAGTLLLIEDGTALEQRYWSPFDIDAGFEGTYEQAADRLDELLQDAVRIRLRSDVPLGVFLSGGIDSSLVTAVAARLSDTPLKTFTVGFGESGFDETPFAEQVAGLVGTQHRTEFAQQAMLELLPQVVRHYGEPYGDSSALPTWLLSRVTREYVTVAVGGDGGDEGFAGYNWYGTFTRLALMSRLFRPALARAGAGLLPPFDAHRSVGRAVRALRVLGLSPALRFGALRTFVDDREAGSLYAGDLAAARATNGNVGRSMIAAAFEAARGSDLRRMRAADVATYLADDLMPKVDVASMAHGLEVRAPLLDHRIIEFALSLPDEWLRSDGTSKRILRTVLGRYLPLQLFERKKQGFTVPISRWFGKELRPRIDKLSHDSALIETSWFQPTGIRAIVKEHARGVRDHTERLYYLLVLDEWLRQCPS